MNQVSLQHDADDLGKRRREIYQVTVIGAVVKFLLFVVKLLAGIFGRSSAMVADSVHSLSDLVTDFIVLAFVKVSGRPADSKYPFGYGKFETLASLIIGLILFGVGVTIVVEGAELVADALNGVELERPTMLALVVAAISVVAREWLYHFTISRGRRLNSAPVIANAWHHRADALTSAGTLIAIAGAMFLGDKWRILDPLAAIIVGAFVVKVGVQVVVPALGELMEHSLPAVKMEQIRAIFGADKDVLAVNKIGARRVGNTIAVNADITLPARFTIKEGEDVTSRVTNALRKKLGQHTYITIQIHSDGE